MLTSLKSLQKRTWILFLALIVWQAIVKNNFAHSPRYNWDALPYMALVLKLDGVENDSVRHAMAFTHAKEKMPEEYYRENVDNNNKYRQIMAEDYKAFTEQMPLYNIKAAYIAFVYLLYKFGIDLLTATYLPSLLAFYLIGWMLFFFISIRANDILAVIVAALFSLTPSALSVVALSSPDGFSAIFMLAGLMTVFINRKSRWMTIWFLMAVLSRRDNILFVGLLYASLLFYEWRNKENVKIRIVEIAVFVLAYSVIGWFSGNPGWKATFMQSFAYKQPYFLSVDSGFKWEIYWDILDRVFVRLSNKSVLFFALCTLVLFGPFRKDQPKILFRMNIFQLLFLIIVVVNIVRFFLFPDIHDRFYFSYFAMLCLIILESQVNNRLIDQ